MSRGRVRVSIPVFAECDPSIIYGVFDTLWGAGRVWDGVKGGTPEGLFEPRLVGAEPGPIKLITGVSILPQDLADHVKSTDIVFVPNVIVTAETGTAVLDRRLSEREYLADEYSIADIATWPWIARFDYQTMNLNAYPNLKRWYLSIAHRPAVQAGFHVPAKVQEIPLPPVPG